MLLVKSSGTSSVVLLFFPHPPSFPRSSSCFPVFLFGPLFLLKASLESSGLWFLHYKDAQTHSLACCLLRCMHACVCVWAIIVNICREYLNNINHRTPRHFAGHVLTDIFLQSDHLSCITVLCPLLLKWVQGLNKTLQPITFP